MKYRFLNSLVFLSILLSLTLGAVGVTPAYAASSITFDYTGAEQQYVVPAGVYLIKVDASGAQGQSGNAGSSGGLGARAQATIAVTPGETLYIYVGGLNGYNGGGTGYSTYGNGGGASDVRQSGNGTGNRVVVAGGGGGGGGYMGGRGGNGGDTGSTGVNGINTTGGGGGGGGIGGSGGTNYFGGDGGSGNSFSGGAGGGGHAVQLAFGGGGGGGWGGGGGGGGYGLTNGGGGGGGGGGSLATGGTITSGYKGGNGQVILTPLMDFTVTFNGNGNTGGTMSNQSASVPTALTLNTFTKTGYTFAGWNTALGGNGTAYADGAIYNFSADVTLYAQWNIAPKVTTDSIETLSNRQVNATLSDLGSPASVTAHGVVYSTTSNPDTGDSMVDIGSTTTTGPFTVGLDAMSLTPGTQYYVRAFATNATGTSYGNELVVYGTPGAFTTIAPADGATDLSTSPTLSWNASTGATDYQYCVQANIADCVADMFGANWHSTGGATSANLSGLSSGTNYSWAVRAVVGTPASYKWATDAPFTFTTAAIPSHTVTFNGNGSNGGSMKNQSANSATALTANAFTRSGYTFSGWNTAANGSGTAYADGATYSFSTDITLYAQWTALPLTFTDVPLDGFGWAQIEAIYNAGITSGCGAGSFCPNGTVTRAQMAVFLLRGIHGAAYTPPAATGTVFNDVPSNAFAAAWIEQLAAEGITSGCGNGNYCPDSTVTRAQMAVFLLRAKYGSAHAPSAATGTIFTDVPSNAFAAAWIEQLAAEGITSGCNAGNYCPGSLVTRAQMAVFIQRTFNLPLP